MREIKFRMWDTVANKYFTEPGQVLECLKQQITGIYDHCANGSVFEQYTELKDKNGKEIYEGDIVKSWRGVYTVEYDDLNAGFFPFSMPALGGFEFEFVRFEECEVIGNIHENVELLKAN